MYIVSNEVLLQVHLLQTLFFSEDRHTFVVQKTKQMYFVWSTDIQDCCVYAVYYLMNIVHGLYSLTVSETYETSFYIVLKYNIL